jgi:ankyrin repeat protein
VEMHPAAVKTTNNDGNLPLHLACNSQASLEVVQFLVEMDPTLSKRPTMLDSGPCTRPAAMMRH